MKKNFLFIFLQLASLYGVTQVKVKDLTVEYLTNPVGIDVVSPRFSWVIESKLHNLSQSAYQILVASSKERLESTQADIASTGKVTSGSSVLVSAGQLPLESFKRYYWKVRIWDQLGKSWVSSQTAFFEMGILAKNDWKAKWISAPKVYDWQKFVNRRKLLIKENLEDGPSAAPEFRKTFSLTKEINRARLYIAGVGFNVPYINGQKAGDHLLDPAFTRYDKTVLYSTYDVTAKLQTGENVLGVVLGNGWYNMTTRAVWGFDHASWRNEPALIAQLKIDFTDGSYRIISSDSSWEVAPGPIVFNSIRQGEFYDARKETRGWDNTNFNDSNWYRPLLVPGPKGTLRAAMIQPVTIAETLTPKTIRKPKPGLYVFDLGKNIAGFAQLKIHAPAGTVITLKYAERLSPDGTVDQSDIAQHVAGGRVQTDEYTCSGRGTEIWHPSFTYDGFQYIEVKGLLEKPDPTTVTAMVIHTAFKSAGSFTCSNELFNKIQQCALASYNSNFMGYPTDCPQREKNGWTGDAHLAAEMGLYNFKAENGYTKWLADIADEQRPTGELSAIVPSSGWGYFWGNGPAWDNAMVLIPWYLYEYSGDQRILEQMYPHIKRYVDYLGTRAENHIIKIGLGDWAPAKTPTTPEVTSTAYYYVDALLLSKMAALFDFREDQVKYQDLAADISNAFHKQYYHGNGIYSTGSQTALACALYQGLTGSNTDTTLQALVKAVAESNDHLDCGILGTKYLLHALSDNGRPDLAYKIVNQHSFPGWGYWMDQGATTLWEQWDGTESHNHIMFGDVSAWFYETLAGIAPAQPGYKSIAFKPYFAPGLTFVKATHQSMYGEISAAWTRKGKTIDYEISIPANTTGEVTFEGNKKVFIDHQPLSRYKGISSLRLEKNETKFLLGSGHYVITISEPPYFSL